MNEDEILQRLTAVFREIFRDPTIVARPQMTAADVEKWDSVSHIDMIMMVESEFGIRIPTLELMGLQTVGDLVRMIRTRAAK
jgi:acyl carrier protein